jgi:ATP-dependent HslUV protease, peptidase subunit HslV
MLIAVQKDGVVCMAKNKHPKDIQHEEKVVSVADSYFGIHGTADVCQAIEHYFQEREGPVSLNSSDEVFAELFLLHKALKKACPFSVDLNALIINPYGIFNVSSKASVIECGQFYAIGYRSRYALGAMEILYDREDSSEKIVRIISEISSEPSTGVGATEEMYTVLQKGRKLKVDKKDAL